MDMYGYSAGYPFASTAQAYAAQYQSAAAAGAQYGYGQTDSYYSAFGSAQSQAQTATGYGAYGTPVQPPPPPPADTSLTSNITPNVSTFESQGGQSWDAGSQSGNGWRGRKGDQRGWQAGGRNQGGNRNDKRSGYGRFVKGGILNSAITDEKAREKAEKQLKRQKEREAREAEEARELAAKEAEEFKEKQRLQEMFPDEDTEDKGDYYCLVCRHECNDDRGYRNHIKSMIHAQRCLEAEKLPADRRQKLGLEIVSEEAEEKRGTPSEIRAAIVDGGFSKGPKIEDLAKSAQIRCEVCNCDMTGPKAYEAHMSGIRHKKNLKNRESGVPISRSRGSKLAKPKPRLSVVAEQIRTFKDPLVGLEYITEHQKNDPYVEPRYSCSLCESKCDPRTLFSHVTGLKHRMSYMKIYYPSYHAQIKRAATKKSDQAPTAEEYCRIIELEIGRSSIKAEMEIDPFYDPKQEMKAMKRQVEAYDYQSKQTRLDEYGQYYNTNPYGYSYNSSYYADSSGYYGSGYDSTSYASGYDTTYAGQESTDKSSHSETQSNSSSSMQEKKVEFEKETEKIGGLLKSLSKSMVNNEDEAEMALTISKALTNALLSYRTKQKASEEQASNMDIEESSSMADPQASSTRTCKSEPAETSCYGSWQPY